MGKACWACKKRKVRCNLKTPTCSNCVKSNTKCQYGILLSWPRTGDARRSIVLNQNQRRQSIRSRMNSDLHILGVEYLDFMIHDKLLSKGEDVQTIDLYLRRDYLYKHGKSEQIPRWLSWIPLDGDVFDGALISYYEQVVATTLTSSDDTRFKGLLLSMSFVDSSSSSIAVRQALYALTALHLYEFEKAMQFRAKAISALLDPTQSIWSIKDWLQNIAAGLLLSLFEMYDSSVIQYDWAQYICRAKTAAHYAYCADQAYEGDARILLEWLFYHDSISRFSAHHWGARTPGMDACAKDKHIRRTVLLGGSPSKIMSTVGCSVEVLEAIASICDYVYSTRHDLQGDALEHPQSVDFLERQLMYAKQYVFQEDELERSPQGESARKVAELYRLAGLIYLYRACKRLPSTSPKVQAAVDAGFDILASLKTCDRAFPLAIIGCEAGRDQDRLMIMDLLRRTRECRKLGNFGMTQQFIEASWAQDDLCFDEELNYGQKFDAIMSVNKQLPCFT